MDTADLGFAKRHLDADTPSLDLIASADLRADLSLAADAMTDRHYHDGHPIVRIHFGLPAWASELAHTITPFLVSSDNSRPVAVDVDGLIECATPNMDMNEVARLLRTLCRG